MTKILKALIALCFILNQYSAFTQNQKTTSTSSNSSINITKDELALKTKALLNTNQYKEAIDLLSINYTKFENDLEINWLFAYAFLLSNNTKKADEKFNTAIRIAPDNRELQLEYARFLYNSGNTKKLEPILTKEISINSPYKIELMLMQANIKFWKGEIKASRTQIEDIKKISKNDATTKKLEEEIETLTATHIQLSGEYQKDTQPLEYIANHISVSEFVSKYFSPKLEISRYRFSPQNNGAFIATISNQFYTPKIKLTTTISGGVYANVNDETDWIGGIEFKKSILKNASFTLGYLKSAMLGTVASTTFNLTQQDAFGVLDYNNKFIALNIGANYKFFADGNSINSISSWLLSQPIKAYKFDFQLGYGFNYTDAKNILFFYDSNGLGTYDPYFTPKEQIIHSGLFIVNFKPFEKLSLQGKANYGFKANVQNPYPLQVAPNVYGIGGFYDAPFDYREYVGSLTYQLSITTALVATYIYQSTFFYDRENANVGLNFTF